jgi:GntR family transcriptional regulator/MocR family aminotransferase
VKALTKRLASSVAFDVPPGGMALWARVADGVDVERWARRCLARGVLLRTGRAFTHDQRPIPFVRLHFAALDEGEIGEAVDRMASAL